jgi:hypothetical protein
MTTEQMSSGQCLKKKDLTREKRVFTTMYVLLAKARYEGKMAASVQVISDNDSNSSLNKTKNSLRIFDKQTGEILRLNRLLLIMYGQEKTL